MKSIARFSVNYPVTILMIVLAVVLLGVISFQRLGMDLFPDMNNPRLYVTISAGERPPEEIERQFVEQIEALAVRQKNVIGVSSVCRTGSAEMTVEYAWETDMDDALLDLQKSLNSFSQNQNIDELSITQLDPNASPVLLLGFSNPEITDMDQLRRTAANYLRNEFIRQEGIADVRVLGGEEKEVIIETNQYMLSAFNLSSSTIASKIQAYNQTISGGTVVDWGTSYSIRGVASYETLDDIRNIIVAFTTVASGGTSASSGSISQRAPVYLHDVATVEMVNKTPDTIVHLNGQRCIALEIYKDAKYNTVNTVEAFNTALAGIKRSLPGYELTLIRNQGQFITSSVNEVEDSALYGILLAVLVLFVFLRRIGTTFVISIAIPISVIATFNLMYFNGLTLNIMTLGGLALGAGMLVDNAIVVMENIFRLIENGTPLVEAIVEGTGQVGGAITSSTLTTIVVFLPIVYLHGTAGELFRDQAWTVTFSLLASLVVALLVMPVLASKFLKRTVKSRSPISGIKLRGYRPVLAWFLSIRWLVILLSIVAMAGGALLIPIIGSEFLPKTDSSEFTVALTFPEGNTIERTNQAVQSIEAQIKEALGEHIATIYCLTGSLGASQQYSESSLNEANKASMYIVMKPDSLHVFSMNSVIPELNSILSEIPDLEAQVYQEQAAMNLALGSQTAPLVIDIKGEELDKIQVLTEQAMASIKNIEGVTNIETSFGEGRPEVNIVLDRARAGILGITLDQVNSAVSTLLKGTSAGEWQESGELRTLTVNLPKLNVNMIPDVQVGSSTKVPLSDVAHVEIVSSPKQIIRTNQSRVGRITAQITGKRSLDKIVGDITASLDSLSYPPRYTYEIGGEEQQRRESFGNLKFALLLSLVLVYMVLASQFESMLHPFIILLTIPLACVGSLVTFFILGMTMNIMAYIGIIMLAGIAVNDSIVLVDRINQLRREGEGVSEAILNAGEQRIRPILMTSLTTILGLVPLTFSFGEGASLRAPMAWAVIGGLTTSTLLTLVVIPCYYFVLARIDVLSRNK